MASYRGTSSSVINAQTFQTRGSLGPPLWALAGLWVPGQTAKFGHSLPGRPGHSQTNPGGSCSRSPKPQLSQKQSNITLRFWRSNYDCRRAHAAAEVPRHSSSQKGNTDLSRLRPRLRHIVSEVIQQCVTTADSPCVAWMLTYLAK